MQAPSPVVVVGIGELGGVFSCGLLRAGHPVIPVTRQLSPQEVARRHPDPALVLVTVREDDLAPLLGELPDAWRSRVGLVQNELLPRTWLSAGIEQPTLGIVWFEKKPGREVHNVLPTVLAGPQARLLQTALSAVDIPCRTVSDDELLHELVAKNLYILALNLAGLETEGTAGDLLTVHRSLLDALAGEILTLQKALVPQEAARRLDDARLIEALEAAIASDPAHGCAGRTAPARLARNLKLARELGLTLPTFERLGRTHLQSS